MMYYDATTLPLWQYAKRYILADHFFHAAFGGSFLNHFWLVCACTPRFDNAPADLVAQLDANGALVRDGAVTPDGYAVNDAGAKRLSTSRQHRRRSSAAAPNHGRRSAIA